MMAGDTIADLMATADVPWVPRSRWPLPPWLRSLLLAMFVDAITIAEDGPGFRVSARERREARRWIAADDDSPLGFPMVCAALGFDPDAVRAALQRGPTGIGRALRPVMAGDRHQVAQRAA
jgi:hypothetical protein